MDEKAAPLLCMESRTPSTLGPDNRGLRTWFVRVMRWSNKGVSPKEGQLPNTEGREPPMSIITILLIIILALIALYLFRRVV